MSWEPLNLRNLEDRPATRPTILGLLYPGKRHVFSGPPESAKTLLAYAAAITVARDGGTVLLVDFEMGPWDARDRLREMGAADDDLDRVLYFEPDVAAGESTVTKLIDAWEPTLVILDAAAGAYDLQRLDDNKRGDVEKFTRTLLRPFWLRGVTTLTLDHVVKNADTRGRFAIGSERKTGGADVHLGFETVTALHRGGEGLYRLITHKDRIGWLTRPTAAEFELTSDPETHAIRWAVKPAVQNAGEEHTFRPTFLMERVSKFLEDLAPEPASRNTIEKSVKGKAAYIRQALDLLVTEGHCEEVDGGRQRRLFRSVKTYREADEFVPNSSRASEPEFVPNSSRAQPVSETGSANSSQFVPTSSSARDEPIRPLVPPSKRGGRGTSSLATRDEGRLPVPGDPRFADYVDDKLQDGHLTESEWLERRKLHSLAGEV